MNELKLYGAIVADLIHKLGPFQICQPKVQNQR